MLNAVVKTRENNHTICLIFRDILSNIEAKFDQFFPSRILKDKREKYK